MIALTFCRANAPSSRGEPPALLPCTQFRHRLSGAIDGGAIAKALFDQSTGRCIQCGVATGNSGSASMRTAVGSNRELDDDVAACTGSTGGARIIAVADFTGNLFGAHSDPAAVAVPTASAARARTLATATSATIGHVRCARHRAFARSCHRRYCLDRSGRNPDDRFGCNHGTGKCLFGQWCGATGIGLCPYRCPCHRRRWRRRRNFECRQRGLDMAQNGWPQTREQYETQHCDNSAGQQRCTDSFFPPVLPDLHSSHSIAGCLHGEGTGYA